MRDDAKLSDGVVTLSPPGPDHPEQPGHPEPDPLSWRPHGPAVVFGIRAGRLLGTLELRPARTADGLADGDVDLRYALAPDARGRGLATRAVLLGCAHARAAGARRAVAATPVDDPAAAAVARRAGFVRRGQISRADGTAHDWWVRDLDRD
ncbi:GNAT family N-acetyltransferase [Streptomyces sp. NPDC090025]|uniref:GNAT family N-acetyltransferase n=1 Tax=Streptomyces sp. NPDC090025 TaxID=3365922 RepID=UPI003832FE68